MKARIALTEIPKALMASMMRTEAFLEELEFDKKLLELIRLRVSYINGCAYCVDMHYKEALNNAEKLHRLYSVPQWKETSIYVEKEKACLEWAEYVTAPTKFSNEQELFENLLSHFDKEEIANLTMVIIQINAWNRLMKSFGIEPNHQ